MDKQILKNWQNEVATIFENAGIVITEKEKKNIEIVDFGLNDFKKFGLSILTYINTDRVCAKEMVLLPNQICPEHRHPNVEGIDGKEETFRCRKGQVFLYVSGKDKEIDSNSYPTPTGSVFTVFQKITLNEGEQYTIYPDTLHWFQGGVEGAIVSEFSTRSTDEYDIFSDPQIKRV